MLILCDLRVLGCLMSGHTELSLSSVALLRRQENPNFASVTAGDTGWGDGTRQPGIDPAEASLRVSSVREATPSLR